MLCYLNVCGSTETSWIAITYIRKISRFDHYTVANIGELVTLKLLLELFAWLNYTRHCQPYFRLLIEKLLWHTSGCNIVTHRHCDKYKGIFQYLTCSGACSSFNCCHRCIKILQLYFAWKNCRQSSALTAHRTALFSALYFSDTGASNMVCFTPAFKTKL